MFLFYYVQVLFCTFNMWLFQIIKKQWICRGNIILPQSFQWSQLPNGKNILVSWLATVALTRLRRRPLITLSDANTQSHLAEDFTANAKKILLWQTIFHWLALQSKIFTLISPITVEIMTLVRLRFDFHYGYHQGAINNSLVSNLPA